MKPDLFDPAMDESSLQEHERNELFVSLVKKKAQQKNK